MRTIWKITIRHAANLAFGGLLAAGLNAQAAVPTVSISSTPLTVAVPAHPQVLLAVGNSQSMDGDLGGAIHTGSGTSGYSALTASSSPVNYTVPTGFTAPVSGTASGGSAAYTVSSGGSLYDNSASRLNVAKAGISAVLSAYISGADFALMDYSTGSPTLYQTWVYYMSQASSGFTFTAVQLPGKTYVTNPCFGVNLYSGNNVSNDCYYLDKFYLLGLGLLPSLQWMLIADTSDEPSINDVLYAFTGYPNYLPPLFVEYSGPSPASPYPPYYSLANYNNGNILLTYNSTVPNIGSFGTSPTNAGYVPYSPQVFNALRGFGYGASQSSTTGNVLQAMTTSGASPTTASINTAIAKFTPFLAPETNSAYSGEIKAVAGQSSLAGLMAGALSYLGGTSIASSNGCAASQYVVLLTDGLPTLDLNGNAWPPLGTTSGTNYGLTATFNADGSLATTNDQALTDTITKINALNVKGIKTYVIGLGAGVDPSINPQAAATLTAMAVAGGTASYFPATSATAVAADLQSILSQILAATESTSASAANTGNVLTTSTYKYQPQFTSSDLNGDWTGDLLAFQINSLNGTVSTSANWSAQAQLDSQSPVNAVSGGRNILTWNPTTNKGVPFEWNAAGVSTTSALSTPLTTNPSDTSGQDVLNYIRGSTALYVSNGGKFRTRTHILGDIVDSKPIYVGTPSGPSTASSYTTFKSTYATRTPMLYVGANDGMLHGFNASTGKEAFAYIPNGVYSNLVALTYPSYNLNHQYYADGSPQSIDVQFADSSWHTLLQGGENDGGKTIYSLDVTNPATLTETNAASIALWEYTDSADMGYSYSAPATTLTNVASSAYVTFFGNGYNSPNGKPVLYAVNAQTGALIRKIDLCSLIPTACSSAYANGLSTVETMNSTGALYAASNLLYAGDLQGNIWRVDISSANAASWTVSVLFQARDSFNNRQPITEGAFLTLNAQFPQTLGTLVLFGTGQFLGTPDQTSTGIQSLYGVFDGQSASTVARSGMVQQTLSIQTSTNLVFDTTLPCAVPTAGTCYGWYIDLVNPPAAAGVLSLSGFRSIFSPVNDGSGLGEIAFNLYQPGSGCSPFGVTYQADVYYATGGALSSPHQDTNGDGVINSGDTGTPPVSGQSANPVGTLLGTGQVAAPITFCNSSGCYEIITVQGPNGPVSKTIKLSGVGHSRVAWWEIH